MKKSKFSLLLVLTLALSMFLTACFGGGDKGASGDGDKKGGDKAAASKELRVLESAEVHGMDSVMAQDSLSFTMLNNVNEGLYRLNDKQEPIPGVADGMPTISDDKKTYTVKLKQDLKWSNGDPVTAHDFVFAWQRALLPETKSPYGPYMMIGKIANADKVYKKKVKPEELGIKAKDDYTLEITLVKPLDYFTSLLTFQTFYPQNKKFVEEKGKDFAKNSDNLVFNGPYKLTDWNGPTDSEWGMELNESYWNNKETTIEKLKFNVSKDPQASANAFSAGEADISPRIGDSGVLSQYEGTEDMLSFLEPSLWWLKMNQKENKALQNENIRRAIALTVDKKSLVDDVLKDGSIVADFIVPKEFAKDENGEDFRTDENNFLKTNKEEAKKLWETGLKEVGIKELELVMVDQDTETAKKTASFIKDQLETNLSGLTLNVQSVPYPVRLDREDNQDYDILMGGWGPDYQDPMTYMDLWVTDGGQNKMSYSNPKFDALIKKADVDLATKPAERWKTLQEAEKVLLEEDAAVAPLYQRTANFLVNQKIDNLVHHDLGGEFSYFWAKIEE
ncbi:peptide ABC transporter substrate-binding protein [Peribacillus glennii]|uniref:Peptide ABC transporter substrate-binding protein n=1 Tax=Peribacillus glennii TaxID=2303991 RepID=A0A372LE94_9BACI|nr:peptide ABC transporter substrate-binding protein [Peribacillus glennii]RFU64128.1 peptide ABC transporter substrate-binding protein [Peribacillus glennii]